ncbi:MAG: sigma-70 family RNA polymerase sigma factor [Planctomycetes bacterium]|nr:sigma-70 family RNA polymerase sigma factor [Planctomycetota bacterium]
MHPTDHDLMRRTAEGDGEAFAMLVRRWEGRVARVLAPLVECRQDVEDLRQETFVRVLPASDRYRQQGAFSTWLFRIVLNLARDDARRRRRRPRIFVDERAGRDGAGPPAEATRHELAEAVADALESLPSELREALVLKHYGELTFAEMAELLRTPASTLKSRVALAHRRLRGELARRGVRDADVEP